MRRARSSRRDRRDQTRPAQRLGGGLRHVCRDRHPAGRAPDGRERLLEVVADEGVVRAALEPRRHPLVQIGAGAFGMPSYAASRISAWWKRKPSSGSVSGRRNRSRTSAKRRAWTLSRSSGGVSSMTASSEKLRPDDGGALEHRPLPGLQPVEPLVQDAADRASAARAGALLVGDRGQLLDEERVALGRVGDPRPRAGRGPSASSSASRVRVGERLAARAPPQAPAARPAARSASSGRARQSSSTRAEPSRAARYSTRSRKVGSAQWTSSKTAITGRSRASSSSTRRVGGEHLVPRPAELALVAAGLARAARGAART